MLSGTGTLYHVFRQRIGRATEKPGLVIFLPVAQSPLDYYYGCYPLELLSGEVEVLPLIPTIRLS